MSAQSKSQKAEIPTASEARGAGELVAKLQMARVMLTNYARFDESHGFHEDAAYTRSRIVEIDAALLSARGVQ